MTTIAEYNANLPTHHRDIANAVAELVDTELPDTGTLWHGHPVWRLGKTPVCLVKAYPGHVTFGFWRGQHLTDPSGRLTPGTRTMAAVKLKTLTDIDPTLFTDWVRQACHLEV
ncbi:DUF1801 domain-containing protein [Actinokineospora inagensis]|uniref:DUF1801 domain-containing protein n=1 Tax=Actinokineospora inagensis TaxID=103730 RepID=UPI0004118A95|nr:DUF1801 domain-containing protein [Actinokineospora inagensis]